METTAAIGFFCEDIRYEIGGINSLVGILPDNLNIAQNLPTSLGKLALYIRINFDSARDPGPISQKLTLPSGGEMAASVVEKKVVDAARDNAIREGNSIAGLITRTVMAPFPVTETGRYQVFVSIGERQFRACGLNVQVIEPVSDGVQSDGTIVSTLPWPPSSS